MHELLDALYRVAVKGNSRGYWLFSEDLAQSYAESSAYAEKQEAELRACLSTRDRALFEKYLDNRNEAEQHEHHILFHQGLAMGITLATLGRS